MREAVLTLARHNILSAPVRDVRVSEDAPWTEQYLGVLDMLDVSAFLLHQLGGTHDGAANLLDSLLASGTGAVPITAVVGAGGFSLFLALKVSR